jgi:hypothetical protein
MNRLEALTQKYPTLLIHALSFSDMTDASLREIVAAAEAVDWNQTAQQTSFTVFLENRQMGIAMIPVEQNQGLDIPPGTVLLINEKVMNGLLPRAWVIMRGGKQRMNVVRIEDRVRVELSASTPPQPNLAGVGFAGMLAPIAGMIAPKYPSRPANAPLTPPPDETRELRFQPMDIPSRRTFLFKGNTVDFAHMQAAAERSARDERAVLVSHQRLTQLNITRLDPRNKGVMGEALFDVLVCSGAIEGSQHADRQLIVFIQRVRDQLEAKLNPR